MSDEPERKSYADYVADRRKLATLRAPGVRVTVGDDRDVAYQKEASLTYALDMIGHLLQRIEDLEAKQTD